MSNAILGSYLKIKGKGKVIYGIPKERNYRYDLLVYIKGANGVYDWFYWGSSNNIISWEKIIVELTNSHLENYMVIDTNYNVQIDVIEVFK